MRDHRDLILDVKGVRSVFVETGSAQGDTTDWASRFFRRVITVEYQYDNYRAVVERFWDYDNVTMIHGDSKDWVKPIAYMLGDTPAVWYLDAHYVGSGEEAPSGNTPIKYELKVIMSLRRFDVVVVDDARLFGVDPNYPSLETVDSLCRAQQFSMELREDSDSLLIRSTL